MQDIQRDIGVWRVMLPRLKEVEARLADTEFTDSMARRALEQERSQIKDNLRRLFMKLTDDTHALSRDEGGDAVHKFFHIGDLLSNKDVHDDLSCRAFAETLIDTPAATEITTDEKFQTYLATYIMLLDLFTASLDGPGFSDQVMKTLETTSPRIFDAPEAASEFSGEFLTTRSTASPEVVVFSDLCGPATMPCDVSSNTGGRIDPPLPGLRNLEELRVALGIDSTGNPEIFAKLLSSALAAGSESRVVTEDKILEFNASVYAKLSLWSFTSSGPVVMELAMRLSAAAVEPAPAGVEVVKATTETKTAALWSGEGAEAGQKGNNAVPTEEAEPTAPEQTGPHAAPEEEMKAVHCVSLPSLTPSSQDIMKRWFHKLRASIEDPKLSELQLSNFLAHAVFCVTAVTRNLEDTCLLVDGATSFAGFSTEESLVSSEWFCRAIPLCATALGTLPKDLLKDTPYILARRPRMIHEPLTLAASPRRQDCRWHEEMSVAQLFRTFPIVDEGTAREAVCLDDVAFVCFINYMRQQFEHNPAFATFFQSMCPASGLLALRMLLSSMTLSDAAELYRQFFMFNRGRRVVPFAGEDCTAADEFIDAVFEHLEDYRIPNRALFSRWCYEAAAYVCDDPSHSVDARRYKRFLEYIAGKCIVYGVQNASRERLQNTSLEGDGAFVRRALVEDLLRFESENAEDVGVVARAEEIFDCLLNKDLHAHNGSVSLETAASWYAAVRVDRMVPSDFERWLQVLTRIPYSCSLEHRRERHTMNDELQKMKCEMGMLPDGIDDGYHDAGLLIQNIIGRFGMKDLPSIPLVASRNQSVTVANWLQDCIFRSNSQAQRADLGDQESPANDLRFVLQLAHHDVFTHLWVEEAEREFTAIHQALHPNGEDPPVFSYTDDFFLDNYSLVLDSLRASAPCRTKLLVKYAGCHDPVDAVGVAHTTSDTLVLRSREVLELAKSEYLEGLETKLNDIYDRELLLRRNSQNGETTESFSGAVASYWERLRHQLPHGDSFCQRVRRQKLFSLMDIKGKGFLTLADLNLGLRDVTCLGQFRADFMPVVFRAFFATTEVASKKVDVIYVTASGERFITPRQFRAFLSYLYSYMELYYMFDTLTCSMHLSEDLHVKTSAADRPLLERSLGCKGIDMPDLLAEAKAKMVNFTPAAALYAAAASPYTLCEEAAAIGKVVTLPQFVVAHHVLRHWGVHVKDTTAAFRDINRRCREQGEMHFTGFAVWASEKGLRPEGCHHGFEELNDEIANAEMRILAMATTIA